MFCIETPRLVLIALPLDVMQERMRNNATFRADVQFADRTQTIEFPSEWPGDALVLFPGKINNYDPESWDGMIVDRAAGMAVGAMGAKGIPDVAGDIEIGYGINRSFWGQGYASEVVGALTKWLLRQPTVRRVLAETRTDNAASIRVLEKNGFAQIGERDDEEEGPLFLWARG